MAQIRLPRVVDVVVLVERRITANENELISVTAPAKGCRGVRAKLLADGGEKALSALPRRKVAVKLIGAEGAVARGQEQIGQAEPRAMPDFG